MKLYKIILLFVMSFLIPGTGHIALGLTKRGTIYLAIWLAGQVAANIVFVKLFETLVGLAILAVLSILILGYSIFVAVRAMAAIKKFNIRKLSRKWLISGASLAIVLTIANFFITPVGDDVYEKYQAFRLETKDMAPAILSGNIVLTKLVAPQIERGDIVVYKYRQDDAHFLKRVVGLPGELVEYAHDTLKINGKSIEDPWKFISRQSSDEISNSKIRTRNVFDSLKLGDDEYYILGDNRYRSYDSRHHGPIDKSGIEGSALYIYWPPSRWRNFK